jgi:hypothetical protein
MAHCLRHRHSLIRDLARSTKLFGGAPGRDLKSFFYELRSNRFDCQLDISLPVSRLCVSCYYYASSMIRAVASNLGKHPLQREGELLEGVFINTVLIRMGHIKQTIDSERPLDVSESSMQSSKIPCVKCSIPNHIYNVGRTCSMSRKNPLEKCGKF